MKKTYKEVIVELEGTTTEIVRKKIRFEEDIDIETPESFKDLLFNEFLRPPPSYVGGNGKPFQKETMRILHDEDLSDYSFKDGEKKEPVDDNLVYMSEVDEYGELRRNIKVCKYGHLISWGVKSVLTVGKQNIETFPQYFSKYESCDNDFWFNKDKEEIHDMWKNKEFKSMVESTRKFYPSVYPEWTEKQFRKYHKLFEKGISTKKQREEGGIIIGILNDVDDYRKEYCTQENSILIGHKLLGCSRIR